MSDRGAGEQLTRCEWCGADYAEPGEAVPPERRASGTPTRRPAPPPPLGAEPPTRCEWCGAEVGS